MFNFLKKKNSVDLLAPVSGTVIAIEEVKDSVFSEKMMGDGFAINTTGSTFVACDSGVITMIFETKHAYGMTLSNGVEILVHIGLDTVKEKGTGFKALVSEGQQVEAGTPIIEIDREYLLDKGYDLTTPVIFTNQSTYKSIEASLGKKVIAGKDIAATYIKKD